VSEKFLYFSYGDHPRGTLGFTYSGRIYAVPKAGPDGQPVWPARTSRAYVVPLIPAMELESSLARFAKRLLAADAMWSMAFMAFLTAGMRIADPRNEVRGRRDYLICHVISATLS
jgi:hypothetical protein